MKKILSLLILFFFVNLIYSQSDSPKSIAVTVYNNNLGVIKEIRNLELSKGLSTVAITDVAQMIDPTSVHIKLNGEVIEQNYQYDLVGLGKILSKYLDKTIRLTSKEGEMIEGTLLSASGNSIVLQKSGGGLLMIPNFNEYQISVESLPEGLITKPTLIWTVDSPKSGNEDVEISYQTGGMNWHAEYVAVLNDKDTKLDLKSWVSIENNSGATYKNAKLKLVAGDVNLVKAQRQNVYRDEMMEMAYSAKDKQFEEKEFFEYHIYNLQRPATVAQNETKQISLFDTENVNVNKKYFYQSGRNYSGSASSEGKVSVIVEFKNSKENNLGVPFPKGKVRVYKSDGESIEFIGEDLVDHTPKNEEIKLKIGEAFDIRVAEVQTEQKKISNRVYEQEYEVTFKNRKNEDITIDMEKNLGFNWEVLNSNIEYKKKDATTLSWRIPLKADDENILKFRIRYSY